MSGFIRQGLPVAQKHSQRTAGWYILSHDKLHLAIPGK